MPLPLSHPAPEHYRSRCTLCDGNGWVIEHLLILRVARESAPPLKFRAFVESESEAESERDKLLALGWDCEATSPARKCACKAAPVASTKRTSKEPSLADFPTVDVSGTQAIQHLKLTEPDHKMAAAGDRE